MFRVGITGGIGSGKSTVAKVFGVLGVPVYNADEAARRLLNQDETVRQNIITHFGEESYSNGILNRSHLAAKVFGDPERLLLLNSLTHPATIRDANDWMAKQATPYTLKEAAIIFESGSSRHLDFIIGVSAPLSLRIKRTMERDGLSRDEVMRRMDRQLDEDIKMRLCDAIIVNDEQVMVVEQVLLLHERLLGLAS